MDELLNDNSNMPSAGSSSPGCVNWTTADSSAAPTPGYLGNHGLPPLTIIQASILGISTFLIVISNAFILLVLHQAADCFVDMQQLVFKVLAITDLLTGIFCCALTMLVMITGVGQSFSSPLCAVRGAACTGLTNLSALLITLACLDRFLAVVYPLRYPTLVTIRRAKMAILIVCGLAVSNAGLSTLRGRTVSSGNLCLSDFSSERFAFRPSLVTSLLILTITLILTTVFNVKVMVVASAQQSFLNIPRGRSLKGLRVLIITTGSFFVAILPWNIVSASQFNPNNTIATPMARYVCSVLLMSNSWMNAVIFLLFNARFRKAAKRILWSSSAEGNTTEESYRYSFSRLLSWLIRGLLWSGRPSNQSKQNVKQLQFSVESSQETLCQISTSST